MNILEYRKKARLSQGRLAQMLTDAGFPATQALVSQWESGAVVLTAERCLQIEAVTDGAVTRGELRPDLFGPGVEPSRRSEAASDKGAAASAAEAPVRPVEQAA